MSTQTNQTDQANSEEMTSCTISRADLDLVRKWAKEAHRSARGELAWLIEREVVRRRLAENSQPAQAPQSPEEAVG